MASTKRGNILENIRATIESLSSIKKAEVNAVRALHSIDKDIMPYVNITETCKPHTDSRAIGDERQSWELSTEILILTLDNNAEDLRGDIKVAIEADLTLGGNAENTINQGDTGDIDFDIPSGAQTKTIFFDVIYMVSEGTKI